MKSLIKFYLWYWFGFNRIYFVETNYQLLTWEAWYRLLGIIGGIVLIVHGVGKIENLTKDE